jgi:type IV pilus modification protein PilV
MILQHLTGMKQNRKNRFITGGAGFTLVEVLLVIVIFAVGILGAMAMQTSAVSTNSTSRESTLALEYATDTMERLMQINPSLDDKFNFDDNGDGTADSADEQSESDLNNDGIDNDGDGTADNEIVWHRLPEFQEGTGYTRGGNIAEDLYYSQFMNLTWDITDIDCDGTAPEDAKRIDITVTWDNGDKTLQLTNIRTSIF